MAQKHTTFHESVAPGDDDDFMTLKLEATLEKPDQSTAYFFHDISIESDIFLEKQTFQKMILKMIEFLEFQPMQFKSRKSKLSGMYQINRISTNCHIIFLFLTIWQFIFVFQYVLNCIFRSTERLLPQYETKVRTGGTLTKKDYLKLKQSRGGLEELQNEKLDGLKTAVVDIQDAYDELARSRERLKKLYEDRHKVQFQNFM